MRINYEYVTMVTVNEYNEMQDGKTSLGKVQKRMRLDGSIQLSNIYCLSAHRVLTGICNLFIG